MVENENNKNQSSVGTALWYIGFNAVPTELNQRFNPKFYHNVAPTGLIQNLTALLGEGDRGIETRPPTSLEGKGLLVYADFQNNPAPLTRGFRINSHNMYLSS